VKTPVENCDQHPIEPYKASKREFLTIDLPQKFPLTLVVVIDTEEEFDWSGPFDPSQVSVRNIAQQTDAQDIFAVHGVIPTYAVDYPVAQDDEAVATLKGFLADARCEIGAHLHPWVNPPETDLSADVYSFPGNLPAPVEHAKIEALTARITAAFGQRPLLYKAGRYGIGASTPAILNDCGYEIDASVVPFTDFSAHSGPDFSALTATPMHYGAGLLELPLSVGFTGLLAQAGPRMYGSLAAPGLRALRLPGIAARLGLLERLRLSPEGHTADDMTRQVKKAIADGSRLFMLTYHSSSLLPGATPYVRTDRDKTDFLNALDRFLRVFTTTFGGITRPVSAVARQINALPG